MATSCQKKRPCFDNFPNVSCVFCVFAHDVVTMFSACFILHIYLFPLIFTTNIAQHISTLLVFLRLFNEDEDGTCDFSTKTNCFSPLCPPVNNTHVFVSECFCVCVWNKRNESECLDMCTCSRPSVACFPQDS